MQIIDSNLDGFLNVFVGDHHPRGVEEKLCLESVHEGGRGVVVLLARRAGLLGLAHDVAELAVPHWDLPLRAPHHRNSDDECDRPKDKGRVPQIVPRASLHDFVKQMGNVIAFF